MQCLNPIIAFTGYSYIDMNGIIHNIDNLHYDNNQLKKHLTGFRNLKSLYKEKGKDFVDKKLSSYGVILLPCRKCVNCQINRSREWAIRNSLEAKNYDDDEKMFITLTYDDKHLHFVKLKEGVKNVKQNNKDMCNNNNGFYDLYVSSLWLNDIQDFFKRLRRRFENRNIRYYMCGEYGSQTLRPHYHILLYGLKMSDIDDLDYLYTSNGNDHYDSKLIESIWQNGMIDITGFSDFTAMYVARYATKKIEDNYSQNNSLSKLYKPFNTMSRRPGIASKYFFDNEHDMYSDDTMIYHIDGKTWSLKPLKFFDRLYDVENPDHLMFIKENRKKYYEDNNYFKTLETNLGIDEYLENVERVQNKFIKQRSKV